MKIFFHKIKIQRNQNLKKNNWYELKDGSVAEITWHRLQSNHDFKIKF